MYKRCIKIIFSFLFFNLCIASLHNAFGQRREKQPTGFGAAVVYNFQTAGFGGDLRARIPVYNRMFIVPEVSYYPSFNPYHEMYAGAALHYELFSLGGYDFYLLGAPYYNNWINADDFAPTLRKQHNFTPEAGAGLVRYWGCLRPFIETRYDFKWKENNLRIGIYWYPGSCGKNKKEKCPRVRT